MKLVLLGHPYLTKENDERRASQRHILRALPDHIMSRSSPMRAKRPPCEDAPIVESTLRAKADSLMLQYSALRDFVHQCEDAAGAAQALAFVGTFESDEYNDLRAVDAIASTLEQDLSRAAAKNLDQDLMPLIRSLIALLVLADYCSDDGYRDPRAAIAD